jgi:DNA-binding NarL/FixJ family response regulator
MVTGAGMKADVSHIRTVVVDDSPVFLRTVCTFLAQYNGIEVVATAENAFEALCAIERFRPDLVLLDFHLPLLNGLEALAQIRCRYPATRIVILTGYDEPELRKACLEEGAFAFISKVGVCRELPSLIASIESV